MSKDSESTASRGPALAWNLLMSLLVVVASSYFAYQIAELNVDSARRQQAQEFDIRRKDEARQKRADVYQRFLDAANRFAVEAATEIIECPSECPSPPADFQRARYDFQGSINEIYIYGSAAALRQSKAVAATLPLALGKVSGEITNRPVVEEDFRKAYAGFLSVICQEVPAQPRSEC